MLVGVQVGPQLRAEGLLVRLVGMAEGQVELQVVAGELAGVMMEVLVGVLVKVQVGVLLRVLVEVQVGMLVEALEAAERLVRRVVVLEEVSDAHATAVP